MRLPWPFGRSTSGAGAPPARRASTRPRALRRRPAIAAAPPTRRSRPTGAWRTLPPIQRSAGPPPVVAPGRAVPRRGARPRAAAADRHAARPRLEPERAGRDRRRPPAPRPEPDVARTAAHADRCSDRRLPAHRRSRAFHRRAASPAGARARGHDGRRGHHAPSRRGRAAGARAAPDPAPCRRSPRPATVTPAARPLPRRHRRLPHSRRRAPAAGRRRAAPVRSSAPAGPLAAAPGERTDPVGGRRRLVRVLARGTAMPVRRFAELAGRDAGARRPARRRRWTARGARCPDDRGADERRSRAPADAPGTPAGSAGTGLRLDAGRAGPPRPTDHHDGHAPSPSSRRRPPRVPCPRSPVARQRQDASTAAAPAARDDRDAAPAAALEPPRRRRTPRRPSRAPHRPRCRRSAPVRSGRP